MNQSIHSIGHSDVAALAQSAEVLQAFERVRHLEAYYPDFENWYWGTVVPGLTDGTRLVRTVARHGRVVGVLIAKRTQEERKLSTLWVEPALAGSGIGVRLIRNGCDWVGSETPLATVPEERMPEFAELLPRLGFHLTQVAESYYRPGRSEFVYNGRLIADQA